MGFSIKNLVFEKGKIKDQQKAGLDIGAIYTDNAKKQFKDR